ncbi:MAG: hypothetical protein KBA28_06405 [Syntrophaceae bacterium]|jgi:hypothetical protein|nr:hypothetical protein [Syntrophaceae bacterium]
MPAEIAEVTAVLQTTAAPAEAIGKQSKKTGSCSMNERLMGKIGNQARNE